MENDVREISTQNSGRKSDLLIPPSAVNDRHEAFEKGKQVGRDIETFIEKVNDLIPYLIR